MERVVVNPALGTGSPLRPRATGHMSIVTVWRTLTAFSRHQDVLRVWGGVKRLEARVASCTEPGLQGLCGRPTLA